MIRKVLNNNGSLEKRVMRRIKSLMAPARSPAPWTVPGTAHLFLSQTPLHFWNYSTIITIYNNVISIIIVKILILTILLVLLKFLSQEFWVFDFLLHFNFFLFKRFFYFLNFFKV